MGATLLTKQNKENKEIQGISNLLKLCYNIIYIGVFVQHGGTSIIGMRSVV